MRKVYLYSTGIQISCIAFFHFLIHSHLELFTANDIVLNRYYILKKSSSDSGESEQYHCEAGPRVKTVFV